MPDTPDYGPSNPAPGTSLWRWRNHPDTMQIKDWRRLAEANDRNLAHIDALTAAVEGLPRYAMNKAPNGYFVERAAVLAILGKPHDA